MKKDTKKPIEGKIIGENPISVVTIGDIPKIKSLVHYNVGDINFNENTILDFISFIKQVYSEEEINKRSEEVNKLLESGNIDVVYERLKLAKKNPAELNNLAKDLEDELKKIKKIWNAPFENFDRSIKKAILEIKTISSYLKDVEVDPLYDTCRDNKFNNFTVPILEEVREEIQSLYDQVDCNEYVFSQDPKYYNLGSKKSDIYLIAKMELDLWAKVKNEEILKVQDKGRISQLIQQDFKMWEKIDLPEYNEQNGTNWTISDISQEINARVPKDEIYKLLDFKTEEYIKKQEEIEIRKTASKISVDHKNIETTKDSSIIGLYSITFPDTESKDQFENWLSNRNTIKWNR